MAKAQERLVMRTLLRSRTHCNCTREGALPVNITDKPVTNGYARQSIHEPVGVTNSSSIP